MPNWVYNGLTIEGSPESVDKLIAQMNQPFALMTDDWDMKKQEYVDKEVTYSEPVFAFWNIVKPDNIVEYNKERENQNYWYEFNIREWGVKWDVAVHDGDEDPDTYMECANNGENGVVYYNFQTPWGVADQALLKLSAQYPDLLFNLNFEEETGWGGEWEILRGELISTCEWNSKCVECDTRDVMYWCEECSHDVCPKCEYGQEEGHETHKREEK